MQKCDKIIITKSASRVSKPCRSDPRLLNGDSDTVGKLKPEQRLWRTMLGKPVPFARMVAMAGGGRGILRPSPFLSAQLELF